MKQKDGELLCVIGLDTFLVDFFGHKDTIDSSKLHPKIRIIDSKIENEITITYTRDIQYYDEKIKEWKSISPLPPQDRANYYVKLKSSKQQESWSKDCNLYRDIAIYQILKDEEKAKE